MALPLLTLMIVNIIPVYPHDSFHIHPIYCTMLMIAAEAAFFLYLYVLYKNLKRISFLSRQSLRTELLSQEIDHYQSYLNTAARIVMIKDIMTVSSWRTWRTMILHLPFNICSITKLFLRKAPLSNIVKNLR